MDTTLDRVDLDILDGKPLPGDFIQQHLSPDELCERLNLSAEGLWAGVAQGIIPRPVLLPVNPPLACWAAAHIDEWERSGLPADQLHRAHTLAVYRSLADTIESTLSARPPTLGERN